MRVILHIGTDKTGSTAIQVCLGLNRAWFASRSVYLPTTGFGPSEGHASLLAHLHDDALGSLREELKQAEAEGFTHAVLSWEGMRLYTRRDIKRLGRALQGFDKSVLVYLRDQAEILQSGYLQQVRNEASFVFPGQPPSTNEERPGITHAITHRLKPRGLRSIIEPNRLNEQVGRYFFLRQAKRNYHRMLQRWQTSLPTNDIKIRIFERNALVAGDVVTDFLHCLNRHEDAGFTESPAMHNPSLDVESALLLEDWKKQAEPAIDLATACSLVQSYLHRHATGSRYFLEANAVHQIRRHYARSNRALAKRYLNTVDSPFTTASPCSRTISLQAMEKRVAQLRTAIIQLNSIKTLWGTASETRLTRTVSFDSGWDTSEGDSVESAEGPVSIKFRIPFQMLTGVISRVLIQLTGRYLHEGTITRVTLNGRDLGSLNIADEQLRLALPVKELGAHEAVEIVLQHTLAPTTAASPSRVYKLWGVRFELD